MTDPIDVLIIGAGPAGYTAGIYAARAGLNPVLISGLTPGGQLTITTDVENYPGFEHAVQGPELMESMGLQAANVGTRIENDLVVAVDLRQWPHRIDLEAGGTVFAKTVIVATGATARWLGLESEAAFQGFGVSACATCDGFFYKDKPVIVVGGGNTAVEEALYLTRFASKVTLVHRGDRLRAERILIDRLEANDMVEILYNHVLQEITGSDAPRSVTGAIVADKITGAVSHLSADGVFVAIGHDPASQLFKDQLDLDAHGYIRIASWSTVTSVPTVFAAGDVADPVFRQAVTSAGMGCMAALEAERYLASLDHMTGAAAQVA